MLHKSTPCLSLYQLSLSPQANTLWHSLYMVRVASWLCSGTLWWGGLLLAWVVGFQGPGLHGQAPFLANRECQASLITFFKKQKVSLKVVGHSGGLNVMVHRGAFCYTFPMVHNFIMCSLDMWKEWKERKNGWSGQFCVGSKPHSLSQTSHCTRYPLGELGWDSPQMK